MNLVNKKASWAGLFLLNWSFFQTENTLNNWICSLYCDYIRVFAYSPRFILVVPLCQTSAGYFHGNLFCVWYKLKCRKPTLPASKNVALAKLSKKYSTHKMKIHNCLRDGTYKIAKRLVGNHQKNQEVPSDLVCMISFALIVYREWQELKCRVRLNWLKFSVFGNLKNT